MMISVAPPPKELRTVFGALILQQAHDLSDNERVNQLAFNIQWHYALNITEESDSAKHMCPKALWNIRSIVVDNYSTVPFMLLPHGWSTRGISCLDTP